MSIQELEKDKSLVVNDTLELDTYRIFTYLEQHHPLLIACISALMAIASASINAVAYVYQKVTLYGWNIDYRLINFSTKGQLYYYVLFSLVYYISILLFSSLIQKIFTRYIRSLACVTYYKRRLKKCKAQLGSVSKTFATLERSHKRKSYIHIPSEDDNETLESIRKQIKDLKGQIKSARQDIRKTHRSIAKNMLLGLLAAAILLLPIMFAYQITTSNITWAMLLVSWLLCSGITMCISYIRVRRANKDIAPKKIKEVINRSWPENTEELDRLSEKIFGTTTAQIPPRTIKQTLSDQSLYRIAENLFSVFFALFLTITLMGLTNSVGKTEYWIYTDESQQYVVAYQDETHCILKEAEIDGNQLIVNTSRQKIVSSDNILLMSRKFSKVEKISDGK